jgi:hypothetical protein
MGDDAGEVVTCQLSVSTSEATVETTGESRALRLWLERSKRAGTMNFLLHFGGRESYLHGLLNEVYLQNLFTYECNSARRI